MELQELREKPHLSASGISDYIDCGLLYKFGRIDKLEPEFVSAALLLGIAIHATLAEFYQSKMVGEKMDVKLLHNYFELHWAKCAYGRSDVKYKEGEDYNTLLMKGKELLSVYINDLPDDNFTIVGIEEPFSFEIEGLPVPVIGVFDLVLEDSSGVITIVDHKTSARSYSNSEIDNNMQLTIYQMAAKANGYAEREILLRFDALIKTKTPKFESYYTTRSEWDEKKTAKKIIKVWEGISKGIFIPNDTSWKCTNCAYKGACDEWFRR